MSCCFWLRFEARIDVFEGEEMLEEDIHGEGESFGDLDSECQDGPLVWRSGGVWKEPGLDVSRLPLWSST